MARMKRRCAVVGVLFGVVLALTGCPGDKGLVIIGDPGLDAAIRRELSHPLGVLTVADLERLLQLDARNLGITDLSGLEMARNLYHVDLSDNNISNLSPLANLDNIQVLRLTNNDVASVVSLADLVNLDQLYLAGNPVGDIQPLRTNAINGGLGDGDYVELDAALLSDTALAVDVPFLESQGVTVQLVGGGDNGDGDDGNGGA